MAPKKTASHQPSPAAVPTSAVNPSSITTSAASSQPTRHQHKPSSTASIRNAKDAREIALGVWNNYVEHTPQRVKLLDAFMAFLIVVGVLQFIYCMLAGNYVRKRPDV